ASLAAQQSCDEQMSIKRCEASLPPLRPNLQPPRCTRCQSRATSRRGGQSAALEPFCPPSSFPFSLRRFPSTTMQRSLSARTATFHAALGISASHGGASLLREREHPLGERHQAVGLQALHDLGERLVAGLVEDEAV